MQNYEKAVATRQATYAREKLKVFEPLLDLMIAGAEFTTNQIAEMFDLHRSTARSYREQLMKAGTIRPHKKVTINNNASEITYVIDDVSKAREFIDNLRSGMNIARSTLMVKTRRSALIPGSRIVTLADDGEVPIRKLCNTQVKPERYWMDVFLFGNGPAPSLMMEAA